MKVVGRFYSCLVRQVNEAVRILMSEADCVMNSKSEFHQSPLVRVVAVTGMLEEQGDELDLVQEGRRRGGGRGRGGQGRGRGSRSRGGGQGEVMDQLQGRTGRGGGRGRGGRGRSRGLRNRG